MANSTLIILFSKMLKISKNSLLNQKNIVKENNEFNLFVKWISQNLIIIQGTCVEMAKVLSY